MIRLTTILTAAALTLVLAPSASAAEGGPIQLRRWTGAEAGWSELVCLSDPSKGPGCLTFAGYISGEGQAQAAVTGRTYADPDGTDRVWTARTGNRLFRLATPGADYAYLKGWGSEDPFTGGTVSFALYVPFFPAQPVEFFRHGTAPRAISLHLLPNGNLTVTSGTSDTGQALQAGHWHTISLSYASTPGAELTMTLDGVQRVKKSLPLGGPVGDVQMGIVTPTAVPVALGIDDYVETAGQNAPTHGARINYLIPNANGDRSEWTRNYPTEPCRERAENWQMVAEDTSIRVDTPSMSYQCALTSSVDTHLGGISTSLPGTVDRYVTEGIPSQHRSSGFGLSMNGPYLRDLSVQPDAGDRILGVRPRIRAYAKAGGAILHVGIVDAGSLDLETFEVGAGSSTQLGRWGLTRSLRQNGMAWDAASLGSAGLHLESGASLVSKLSVFSVRLDYIWVPA